MLLVRLWLKFKINPITSSIRPTACLLQQLSDRDQVESLSATLNKNIKEKRTINNLLSTC